MVDLVDIYLQLSCAGTGASLVGITSIYRPSKICISILLHHLNDIYLFSFLKFEQYCSKTRLRITKNSPHERVTLRGLSCKKKNLESLLVVMQRTPLMEWLFLYGWQIMS